MMPTDDPAKACTDAMFRPLAADAIDLVESYRIPSFDSLLCFASSVGLMLDPAYARLNQYMPRLDKAYWMPERTRIAPDRPNGCLSGHAFIHHALHHLVAGFAPGPKQGLPRLALLGEAVASAANLYFCLRYHERDGIEHEFVAHELAVYKIESERTGVDLLGALQRAQHDPFAAYREAVEEIDALAGWLFETMAVDAPAPDAMADLLQARIAAMRAWPLVSSYDYATFVLHTLWHCGSLSDSRDADAVAKVKALLAEAGTFEAFVDGAIAQVTAARSGRARADTETRRTARS